MKQAVPLLRTLILLCTLLTVGSGRAEPLAAARSLFQRADYRAVIERLVPLREKSPAAWALLGKAYYGEGEFAKAIDALEKAVAGDPGRSDWWDWLGRAYGRRAEKGNILKALGRAKKAREAFEKAVEIDPNNVEALVDLFLFYLEAPRLIGGGAEKAARLAERLRQLDPAEYEWTRAELAKKRKNWAAAESHLRRALELEPRELGRLLDLAAFLMQRGRYREAASLFAQAERLAPAAPKLLFVRAQAYAEAGRNRAEARRLLQAYLEARLTPDDPPRWEARELLAKLERD
ncbi:MAG TPA: tetratricopeptide repeat protein [Bryobacterales bacterium]|nr:tetratricopeptide repeat protein [Bryobacterales bacterium]